MAMTSTTPSTSASTCVTGTTATGENPFDYLDDTTVLGVFAQVSPYEVFRMSGICKRFRRLALYYITTYADNCMLSAAAWTGSVRLVNLCLRSKRVSGEGLLLALLPPIGGVAPYKHAPLACWQAPPGLTMQRWITSRRTSRMINIILDRDQRCYCYQHTRLLEQCARYGNLQLIERLLSWRTYFRTGDDDDDEVDDEYAEDEDLYHREGGAETHREEDMLMAAVEADNERVVDWFRDSPHYHEEDDDWHWLLEEAVKVKALRSIVAIVRRWNCLPAQGQYEILDLVDPATGAPVLRTLLMTLIVRRAERGEWYGGGLRETVETRLQNARDSLAAAEEAERGGYEATVAALTDFLAAAFGAS